MLRIDELLQYQKIEVLDQKPVSVITLTENDTDNKNIINILECFNYKYYKSNKYYSFDITPINQLIKKYLLNKIESVDIDEINNVLSYFNFSIRKIIVQTMKKKGLKHIDIINATSITAPELSTYFAGTRNFSIHKLDTLISYLGLQFFYQSNSLGGNIKEAINKAIELNPDYYPALLAKEIGVSKQNFAGFLKSWVIASGTTKTISYENLEKCLVKLDIELK